MKKQIAFILLIAILMANCLCCTTTDEQVAWESLALGQVIAMQNDLDLDTLRVEELERDEYGRVLFKAHNSNQLYNDDHVIAYMICQKTEGRVAYCYSGICYELALPNEKLSDEKMNDLKERNDWNKPLDTSRFKGETQSSALISDLIWRQKLQYMDYEAIKRLFLQETGNPESYVRCETIAIDKNGLGLLAIGYRTELNPNRCDSKIELYIMSINPGMDNCNVLKIDDKMNCWQQIEEFKKSIGWIDIQPWGGEVGELAPQALVN